ncbi:hypothetical protein [Lysinibacillus xylanilyticus]|uniref:hypothetical protein n=1 Tax=Lysinibacillus xylanilyticus TaxID=582475 RepID=UPI003D00D079
MNSNNNGCHQSGCGCGCRRCSNGKFNCTGVRPFRAIDAACIPPVIPNPIPNPPKEETLAYGSFYNPSGNPVHINPTPPVPGQKIIFTTPGPSSLNVNPAPIPNSTTDLQVAISGVYEISMNILVELDNGTSDPVGTSVRLGLFINDTNFAPGSEFGSYNSMLNGNAEPSVTLIMGNTVGNTILLRLNKDDRLSIRVINAEGLANYRLPSLVVTKIAD